MQPISTRARILDYSPEQTFQDAAKALKSGEDAVKAVNSFERNSFVSAANDLVKECGLGSIYADEENAKKGFAEEILKQIVALAFNDDQSEVRLFETPEKAYTLEKAKGKVCFCELSYATEFSISNFRHIRSAGKEEAKDIHCEIDIRALRTNIDAYLKNKSINANSPAFALLDNNPRLLDFAIEHILEKSVQYQNVIKGAVCHVQLKEREAEIKKRDEDFSRLEFSAIRLFFLRHDEMTPEFREFVSTGKKPEDKEKTAKLFFDYFKITVEKSSSSGEFGYPIDELRYYQYILRDITHLNMKEEYIELVGYDKQAPIGDRKVPNYFVRPLFQFLRDQYEGNSLEFGYCRSFKGHKNDFEDSLCELIKCNSHLTSVKFSSAFGHMCEEKVIKAILSSSSITDVVVTCKDARQILKKPNLRSLEILGSWDEDLIELIPDLIGHPSLATLKVRIRTGSTGEALTKMKGGLTTLHLTEHQWDFEGEELIWSALAINRKLTSFKLFPSESIPRKEQPGPEWLDRHLQSNFNRNTQVSKALLVPSIFDPVAAELIIPQEVIQLICAKLWECTGGVAENIGSV